MPRPKGSRNKVSRKPVVTPPVSSDAVVSGGITSSTEIPVEGKPTKPIEVEKKEGKKKVVVKELPALDPGMKWFEAPDGQLYSGPQNKLMIWAKDRKMWVNEKR